MREVYTIVEGRPDEGGKKKSFWHKVGVAFDPNKDGSINIELFALPVNGKLQIRDPQPKNSEPPQPSGPIEAVREPGQEG